MPHYATDMPCWAADGQQWAITGKTWKTNGFEQDAFRNHTKRPRKSTEAERECPFGHVIRNVSNNAKMKYVVGWYGYSTVDDPIQAGVNIPSRFIAVLATPAKTKRVKQIRLHLCTADNYQKGLGHGGFQRGEKFNLNTRQKFDLLHVIGNGWPERSWTTYVEAEWDPKISTSTVWISIASK